MKTPRNPATLHAPLAAYSHQIEISGAERQLVIAGQVGMTPDGHVPDDPIEQLGVALDNVERNLEAAGMELGDLVRLTIYLVGEWDNDARRAWSPRGWAAPALHDADLRGGARRHPALRSARGLGDACGQRTARPSRRAPSGGAPRTPRGAPRTSSSSGAGGS